MKGAVLIAAALVFVGVTLVCFRIQHNNRKNERQNHAVSDKRFWTWEKIKVLGKWKVNKRILFTIFALFLFKAGSLISIPEVNIKAMLDASSDNPLFALAAMMGGGGLSQFSIFSLGVGPFITAQIIIQLLSMDVIPHFTELAKGGQRGRIKLNQYTKYLAFFIGMMQGYAISYSFSVMYPGLFEKFTPVQGVYIGLLFTAGTMILLSLSNLVSRYGVGNGMSVLIAAGILFRLPEQFAQMEYSFNTSSETGNTMNILLAVMLVMILFTAMLALTEYRIPIQYSNNSTITNVRNYLPLKLNSAGVMPVIFASAIMSVPVQISMLIKTQSDWFSEFSQTWLSMKTWPSLTIYALLIVLFSWIYTKMQINPEELSENLAKSGAYIPSVHPGKQTEKKLLKILKLLTAAGASALLLTALLPYMLPLLNEAIPYNLPVGGTGMIIAVSVIIELYRQIKGIVLQESF